MQIIDWETFLEKGLPVEDGFTAMTVGVFDGVHCGHKALIEQIVHYNKKFLPVIITFRSRHKKHINEAGNGDILSFSQKMAIFENSGVELAVIADLTESFRSMKGADFLHILRNQGKMGFLAVGKNFRCGHNQDTNALEILKLNAHAGIPTEIVEVLTQDGRAISSSRIREAIVQGRLAEAQTMLGRSLVFDISDLPTEDAGQSLIYNTVGLYRILPPPGRYEVLLHIKNSNAIRASVHIEHGKIRISASGYSGILKSSECELVEFLG